MVDDQPISRDVFLSTLTTGKRDYKKRTFDEWLSQMFGGWVPRVATGTFTTAADGSTTGTVTFLAAQPGKRVVVLDLILNGTKGCLTLAGLPVTELGAGSALLGPVLGTSQNTALQGSAAAGLLEASQVYAWCLRYDLV